MTTTFYRHWRDVPEGAWRWPNFSPAEIACRGTGKLLVNVPALDKLQALRDRLGKPLIFRPAWRRVGLALDAALALMATGGGWEGLKATALTALDAAITGDGSNGSKTVGEG